MTQTIRARFRNGKLEPLEPLDLKEGAEVTVAVSPAEPPAGAEADVTATSGTWTGNVHDDFENMVNADRRLATSRKESSW